MKKIVVKFQNSNVLTMLEERGAVSYYPKGQGQSTLQIVFVKNIGLEELKTMDGVVEVREMYKGKLFEESGNTFAH